MAILRPLVTEAAIAFRESVDFILSAIEDTIADDFCVTAPPMNVETRFVPCREGRSLHSPVKRRSIFKRKTYALWSEE